MVAEGSGVWAGWGGEVGGAALDAPAWDGSSPLSEEAAVLLALRENAGILADLETIAAARADRVQAGLLPNPVVSVALGFPIAGTDGGTQVTAGAMQMLADLWRRPHRAAAAEARLRGAVLSVSERALGVVAEVRSAHARAAAADVALALQEELVGVLERRAAAVELATREGEASLPASASARLELARGMGERVRRQREADVARRELLEQIGRAGADAGFALERRGRGEARGDVLPGEFALVEEAKGRRLTIAAAMAARDGASAALREAGLAALPDLAVGAMYEREMDGAKMLGPAVQVGIPIFDTGAARRAGAAAEARRVDLAARGVVERVIREVRVAHRELAAAEAGAEIAGAGVARAAADLLAYARAAYEAGEATVLDVLAAEAAAVEAEILRVDAELGVEMALIALERAVGGRVLKVAE